MDEFCRFSSVGEFLRGESPRDYWIEEWGNFFEEMRGKIERKHRERKLQGVSPSLI